ncbi:unnamed protein product [Ixodes pacificus]
MFKDITLILHFSFLKQMGSILALWKWRLDQPKALGVLYGQAQLFPHHIFGRVHGQVQQVEAGVCHRQVVVVHLHRLQDYLRTTFRSNLTHVGKRCSNIFFIQNTHNHIGVLLVTKLLRNVMGELSVSR